MPFRQSKANAGSEGTPKSLAFDSAILAGSTLVLGVRFNSSVATISISDDKNGAWTQAGTKIDLSGITYACFYKENAAAGVTTVTVDATVGSFGCRFQMAEYDSMAAASVDIPAIKQASGTSTTPSSGATATRAQANEIVVGIVAGGGAPYSAGSGFTARDAGNTSGAVQIEDQTFAVTGTDAATFTGSNAEWGCWAIPLKPASGASTWGAQLSSEHNRIVQGG